MTRVPVHHVVVLSTLRTEQFAAVLALAVPVVLFAALVAGPGTPKARREAEPLPCS